MDGITLSQAISFFSAAGVLVFGLIKGFSLITHELDARRQRAEARIGDSLEIQRLKLDYSGKGTEALIEKLWKLNDDQEREIKELKAELEDAEKAERINRPTIMKIFTIVREIRNEMDSLNIMLLNEEETNVFARRWGNVKIHLTQLEAVLAGDDK